MKILAVSRGWAGALGHNEVAEPFHGSLALQRIYVQQEYAPLACEADPWHFNTLRKVPRYFTVWKPF